MIIELRLLGEDPTPFRGTEPAAVLDLGEDRFTREVGEIAFDLAAEHVGDELIVRGTVRAAVEQQCSRCAEFFSTTVSDSSFLRDYLILDHAESVDITGDLREAILLNLPTYPACSPGCQGLCPQCGANRNRTQCGCEAPRSDARWEALDGLHLQDESTSGSAGGG